jgi:hypothetical protein
MTAICRSTLLAALLALLTVGAAPATRAAETAPAPKGLRVFTCGHSFHMFVVPILNDMALAAGIKDHVIAGRSGIGGSRVIQHWDVADDKNEAKKALSAGTVDVLTLAPIWLPEEGIEKFAKLGFDHNPAIRVTVQEYWLPNDTYEPKYPLDTRKKVDHDTTDLAELQKNQDKYDHDVDEYCRDINKRLGKDVIVTVPVGQAVVALRRKIAAGEAPGLTKGSELFRDMWGHPTVPVQVLSGYCHYAVIYRRNPVGLPVPLAILRAKNPAWDEKLNRLLQELAWEAVTHHAMSGVTAETK